MLHLKTFRTRSIGWALFGVNFRPLQKSEAIMGGGGHLILGIFSRDYGILSAHCTSADISIRLNVDLQLFES